MTSQLAWLLGVPGAAFLLILAWPALRRAYGLGGHCLARHPVLWKLPAGFALAYGCFDFIVLTMTRWRGGRAWPSFVEWQGTAERIDWDWTNALSVMEQTAGTWNCLVSVFPLSVMAALLFVVNRRGLAGILLRALRQRFGALGWILMVGLVLCAVAEMVKPALMLFLPELALRFSWQWLFTIATALNALAFVFEYLLGTTFQLYLLLTVYGWARGLQFEEQKMLPFAVRRLGFVIKWSLVIITATLLLIHLPLAVEAWWVGSMRWPADGARLGLALAMLAGGAVQIQLALHNDSLREALAANTRFLKNHGSAYLGVILSGMALFAFLGVMRLAGEQMLGNSLAAEAWTIGVQVVAAAAGGWILAAWVCFYQERAGGKEIVY